MEFVLLKCFLVMVGVVCVVCVVYVVIVEEMDEWWGWVGYSKWKLEIRIGVYELWNLCLYMIKSGWLIFGNLSLMFLFWCFFLGCN